MLKQLSHSGGATDADEILFTTPFGYLFPELAKDPESLLLPGQDTTRNLVDLGEAMAADGPTNPGSPPAPGLNSSNSSFFTYFGQFIDHDITARTDRETAASAIFAPDGSALPIEPRDPDDVVRTLKNGRRPQFDLDNVYGDGPSLLLDGQSNPAFGSVTTAQDLYDQNLKFHIQSLGSGIIDLPRPRSTSTDRRPNERVALIADMRNDENINISQLHAAFLSFHNIVMDGLDAENAGHSSSEQQDLPYRFTQARQLVRWTYQYLVVESYLKTICLPDVVEDVKRNGPTFYGPVAGGLPLFMPLEFSVAGFRFGHSMIRPSYTLRNGAGPATTILGIQDILGPSTPQGRRKAAVAVLKDPAPNPDPWSLLFTADWSQFFGVNAPNKARKIDTLIARGLSSLTFVFGTSVMAHLARRNLLRGFSLSIPTGQAIAAGFGVASLTPRQIRDSEQSEEIGAVLDRTTFASRTPLWYYILREADVHTGGERLGAVGSRLVAECIIGLLKRDPNSYINQYAISRNVAKEGIVVPTLDGRRLVGSAETFLNLAGVYPQGPSAPRVPPRDRLGT